MSADDGANAGSQYKFTPPPLDALPQGMREAANAFYGMLNSANMAPEELAGTVQDMLSDRDVGRILEQMSQAYMVWMNQGMRYWGTLSERHSTYFTGLLERAKRMRADPSASDAEQRALVDEAEQYLREVADLTMREGRLLTRELERLCADLRANLVEPLPNGATRRFVKAKE